MSAQPSHSPEASTPVTSPPPTGVDHRPPGWKPLNFPIDGLDLEDDKPSWTPEGLDSLVYTYLSPEECQEVPQRSAITEAVCRKMADGRAHLLAEDLCHMDMSTGYWCRLGKVGLSSIDVVKSEPEGHVYVPVNTLHMDFGVRFPLHPFLSFILATYKVALNQITPASLRKVTSFIWVCEFLNFPLTLDLFRACFALVRGVGVKGYWTFSCINNRVTCCPTLDSSKGYQPRNVYVRVPVKAGHMYRYLAPLWFSEPAKISSLKEEDLKTGWEKMAFRYFEKKSAAEPKLPMYWLPHADLLRVEDYLALGNLSYKCSADHARQNVSFTALGITPNSQFFRPSVEMVGVNAPHFLWERISGKRLVLHYEQRCQKGHYVDPYDVDHPTEAAAPSIAARLGDADAVTVIPGFDAVGKASKKGIIIRERPSSPAAEPVPKRRKVADEGAVVQSKAAGKRPVVAEEAVPLEASEGEPAVSEEVPLVRKRSAPRVPAAEEPVAEEVRSVPEGIPTGGRNTVQSEIPVGSPSAVAGEPIRATPLSVQAPWPDLEPRVISAFFFKTSSFRPAAGDIQQARERLRKSKELRQRGFEEPRETIIQDIADRPHRREQWAAEEPVLMKPVSPIGGAQAKDASSPAPKPKKKSTSHGPYKRRDAQEALVMSSSSEEADDVGASETDKAVPVSLSSAEAEAEAVPAEGDKVVGAEATSAGDALGPTGQVSEPRVETASDTFISLETLRPQSTGGDHGFNFFQSFPFSHLNAEEHGESSAAAGEKEKLSLLCQQFAGALCSHGFAVSTSEVEKLRTALSEVQTKLASESRDLSVTLELNKDLYKENKKLKEENAELPKIKEKVASLEEQLSTERSIWEAQRRLLLDRVDSLTIDVGQLHEDSIDLLSTHEFLRMGHEDLEAQLAGEKNTSKHLTQQLASVESSLSELKCDHAALLEEFKKKEAELTDYWHDCLHAFRLGLFHAYPDVEWAPIAAQLFQHKDHPKEDAILEAEMDAEDAAKRLAEQAGGSQAEAPPLAK